MRLDQYLVEKHLVESRERGRALIMAGQVMVDGERADKAGFAVKEGCLVEVHGPAHTYASRGGLKLEKALKVFDTSPAGRVCMDVGASSGGFTDCMLRNGARRVYAVDVGYGQLAWKLRCDERVIVMERCNIRNVTRDMLMDEIGYFTVDVSFISIKLVLPVLQRLILDECEGICLVKPQFEAGREKVGKHGVVRQPQVHREVLIQAAGHAVQNGFFVAGLDFSPVKGPKGNVEFLMHLKKSGEAAAPMEERVNFVVTAAENYFAQEKQT